MMTSNERRSVFSLSFLYATRMLGLFMVLPVFVLYGEALEHANPLLLGLAIGAYGLSQAIFQIPFGALSDRFGRKPLLFIGLLIFFAGSVIAALSESVYGVIFGRFIQGAGAIASVIMALLSDLTSVESRTKAMAIIGMSIGISFSFALVLGPLVAEFGGLSAIFWLTAVLALVAILWVLVLVPTPTLSTKNRDSRVFKDQLFDVLADRQLLRLDFGIFALHMCLTAMFIAIPVALWQHSGLPKEEHWWVYLLVLVGSFFAMVPLIILGEKRQKMKFVFCFAIALLAVSSLSMVWTQYSFGVFCASLFAFFMAFNLLEASLPSLISKISPAGSKGTAMGVYSTSQFLGAFFGGALGGLFLTEFNEAGVFFAAVAICSIWLLFALTMENPSHESSLSVVFEPLQSQEKIQELSQALINIRGVEDAVVIDDGVAYLKVLSAQLDRDALARVKQQYALQ